MSSTRREVDDLLFKNLSVSRTELRHKRQETTRSNLNFKELKSTSEESRTQDNSALKS